MMLGNTKRSRRLEFSVYRRSLFLAPAGTSHLLLLLGGDLLFFVDHKRRWQEIQR